MERTTTCKTCGAPIIWRKSERTGNFYPVNARKHANTGQIVGAQADFHNCKRELEGVTHERELQAQCAAATAAQQAEVAKWAKTWAGMTEDERALVPDVFLRAFERKGWVR